MASNAYIARGQKDGKPVMKVGKADNIPQREKQIAATIELTIACLDAEAAFRVESQLRDFVIIKGGIRYQGTLDWFEFDPRIYDMLSEFASDLKVKALFNSEEREIIQLKKRYYELIAEERARAAKMTGFTEAPAQVIELLKQVNALQQDLQEERDQHNRELQEERTQHDQSLREMRNRHHEQRLQMSTARLNIETELKQEISRLEAEVEHFQEQLSQLKAAQAAQ
jgi:hypothetical protein